MSDITTTAADQVVEAGGNIYQLDHLLVAYGELLEQAKQQLESFEPDDALLQTITERLTKQVDYSNVAYHLACALSDESQSTQALHRLASIVGQRLDQTLIRRKLRETFLGVCEAKDDDDEAASIRNALSRALRDQITDQHIRVLIKQELNEVVADRFAELERNMLRSVNSTVDELERSSAMRNSDIQAAMRTIFRAVLEDQVGAAVSKELQRQQSQEQASS